MPRRTRYEDSPDDGGEYDPEDDYDADRDYDPDDPETYPEGVYVDPEPAEVPCPNCREEIAEESERCPHCGYYITKEETPPGESKPRWWVVGMVLALLAVLLWVAAG
jgi:hypothetical protein